MRVVLQRVSEASCSVDGRITGAIGAGYVALVGFDVHDDESVLEPMARKIVALRVFGDEEGKMNRSITQIGGSVLSISQFTLYASCKKGNRPSFIESAPAQSARILYDRFNAVLAEKIHVETGVFQADMKIALVNDGPVTIILDSSEILKKREN